jgi:hypothetical protein
MRGMARARAPLLLLGLFSTHLYSAAALSCTAGQVDPTLISSTTSLGCITCGAGKVANAERKACVWDGTTVCAPGTWRPAGNDWHEPLCLACTDANRVIMNAYCAGGAALPVGCAPGTGSGPNNTVSAAACSVQTTCSPGYYLSNGACVLCEESYACAGGTAPRVQCALSQIPVAVAPASSSTPAAYVRQGATQCLVPRLSAADCVRTGNLGFGLNGTEGACNACPLGWNCYTSLNAQYVNAPCSGSTPASNFRGTGCEVRAQRRASSPRPLLKHTPTRAS